MKEITLPVSELREALPGLSKIVGRSRTLPVLQSVRVSRNQDGRISLQATDLDSFATYTSKELQNGSAVVLLIPLDQLNKAVKGLKGEDSIILASEGKDRVKLRYPIAGSLVEQNIGSLSPDEWPALPNITQPPIVLEPGFGLALKQALECSSDDSSRYVLNGACLDVSDKKFHYIVGTNGRSLLATNSFCFDLKKSVIIPDSKFLSWTDLMDEDPCTMSVEPGKEEQKGKGKDYKPKEPGWIKLESPRWTFITKEIDGQYPNWKAALPNPTQKWTKIILSEEAIKQLIQAIPRLPGDDGINKPIRLRADRYLIVEGPNKQEEGWISIPVEAVNVHGKPVTVALNRDYLVKALQFGLNELEIEDPLSPVVLSNGGKKMVIMPVNLDPVTSPPATPQTTPTPESTPPPEEQTQSQEKPETQTERTAMPRTGRTTTPEAMTRFQPIENQNGHNGNGHQNGNGNGSSVKGVVEHIDQIKENLKGVLRDLNDVADALKVAEKEKRTTEKEIEGIRNKLLQIQKVTI